MPELRVGVCYDFRNPPDSGIAMPRLYAEVLDQIAWADQAGFDLVWFTEHHFVEDGYLPSWIPVAAAAAARTRRGSWSRAMNGTSSACSRRARDWPLRP